MKLPNADRAVIDINKLVDYSLSPTHERGRHKAALFQAVMGLGPADAERLAELLLLFVQLDEVEQAQETPFGTRFLMHHPMPHTDPPLRLRHVWIVRSDEDFPRLVTCFLLRS